MSLETAANVSNLPDPSGTKGSSFTWLFALVPLLLLGAGLVGIGIWRRKSAKI